MRNLRKLTAAVLAIAIVLTSMTAVFAATETATVNGDKATTLNQLGLYAGIDVKEFNPDLGSKLTRQQATVMLLKMFGMESKAKAMTADEVTAALKDYTDAAKVSSWAKNAVAYAVANKIMSGKSATTVDPTANITGAEYATLIVKSMGYDVPDYKVAVTQLSKLDGSTVKDEFADADLIRDNAVGYMYGALTAKEKDGTTVIANLVAENPSIADAATKAGLYTPVAPKGISIDTVAALTSKLVEVSLTDATTAADVAGAKFAVKDASGKAINVASAAIAPWSDKSIIVTLEADTTGGTLYTLTFGDKTYNFGGKAVDTTKPGTPTVEATDANEVTITFDEPVKMETLKVAIAESYGTKATVAVNGMKYDGADKIILSVGDMKSATLYKATITDVTDLAGNQLDSNKAEVTFVGNAKSTDALKFDGSKAKANYCDEVAVEFNVNVDPATLVPANFTITEKYGTKSTVAVTAVRLGKDDDKGTGAASETNGEITSDSKGKHYAILTVDGTMKDATLYEIKFSGLKTLYGVAQSTDSTEYTATFVGIKKPTDPVELANLNVGATSNTTFTVQFNQKMDKALAETLSNYSLVESYGTKAALEIKKAELQSNGTEIKFTTATQKPVLYKLTITNLKDIYGNVNKTSDSANIVSVAGKDVATKIEKITSIGRDKPGNSYSGSYDTNTQIVVAFDQNIGSNATDVSLYTIDGGVGYPSKAIKVDGTGNENLVILTIGKTTAGNSYNLTVKGLLNADGVAMGTDGVKASFAGKGNAYTLPKMQAVLATDEQTIKVYFDRSVDSSDIKGAGKIWSETNSIGTVNSGALKLKRTSDTSYSVLPAHVAWKDPDNSNVLVIRTNVATSVETFKANSASSQFILDGTGLLLDGDNDNITFASNGSDVTLPQVTGIIANDTKTVTVYFDQAVAINSAKTANQLFTIGTTQNLTDSSNVAVAISAAAPYKVDDKTYRIKLDGTLTNKTYYLRVATLGDVKDKSGYYSLKETTTGSNNAAVQFGGTTTDATGVIKVSSVSAMMSDDRTLVVYYPERMDVADVTNVSKYVIYSSTDNNGTVATGVSVPTAVVYDKDTYTATLYLSGAMQSNGAAIAGSSTSTYYLGISSTVRNEMALKNINNEKTLTSLGSGIQVPLGLNTTDDAKPTIKNVTVDLDNASKVTVEFDEAVSTTQVATILGLSTDRATADNQIVINDAEWGTATSSAITLFAITDTTTGASVGITSITKTSNTKFEIVVTSPIVSTKSYKITVGTTPAIYNLGGTQIETDSSKRQEFVFTATRDLT